MSSETSHDRLIGTVSLILDRMVHVRLTAVGLSRPETIDRVPVEAAAFWEASRVQDPRAIRVNREWESLGGPRWRELELEGDSEGPGGHWGSRNLVATAHVRREPGPAPFVLMLHGYAVPQTTYDRWLAKQMRLRGAHTARLDLPLHLRRTLPGQRSGDGYFSLDPAHIRAVVRQSVEDAAAVIAWARAEVSPHVAVVGVSLGGLIATMLAAQLELDRVIAVAPFCDPAATLSQRPPTPSLRHLGMIGEYSGSWGPDRASAGRFLEFDARAAAREELHPADTGGSNHPGSCHAGPGGGTRSRHPAEHRVADGSLDLPARSHDRDERERDRAPDRGPSHRHARRPRPVRRGMTLTRPVLHREGMTANGRPYVIRPSQEGDAPGLAALMDAVAGEGELIAAVPGEPGTIEQSTRLVSIVLEGGLTLTLEVDGVPAGHVMVQRRAGRHYAHVGEIAILVSNAQRGLGLGRILMEMAIEWGRAVGLAKISLRVFPDNTRAIALYRSLGFEEEGLARGEVRMPGGDRDVLLMGLALGGPDVTGAPAILRNE